MNNTSSPFDTHAVNYDRWFEQQENKAIFSSELLALKKILPFLPKPWLEIGVGSGRFAQALGISTGLDPSAALLQIAKSRDIITLQGSAEDHNFPAESFGTVFLILTLCFLDNPWAAFREIHRSLKQNGKIVVAFIPAESPWGILYRQKSRVGHDFYKFAKFYTYKQLDSMLGRTGFTIKRVVSTLYQEPAGPFKVESPVNGHNNNAGFVVIVADKQQNLSAG